MLFWSDLAGPGAEGFGQGFLDRPTGPESGPQGAEFDAVDFGGLGERHPLAAHAHEPARPAVPGLCFGGCPAAVVGLIGAVVVQAMDGVTGGRAKPHVGEEVSERGSPALAD